MSKIKINLSLKILPEDQQVFMVRPGSNYHLYDKFLSNSIIAPDIPFLELDDKQSPTGRADIQLQLARASAFRAWQKQSEKNRSVVPSKDANSYKLGLDESLQSRTRLLNVAEKIFCSLPTGGVIFVPANSLHGEALIGELSASDEERVDFYGDGYRKNISYKGRKIYNVKKFPMRYFPAEVTDITKSQSVVQEYEGYAKERILRSYYGDYQLGSKVAMMEFEALKDKFDPITMARITALAASIENYELTGNFISPGDMLFSLIQNGNLEIHATINSKNGKLLVEGVKKVPHILRALILASSLVVSSVATADEVAQMLTNGEVEIYNDEEVSRSQYIDATQNSLVNFSRAAGFSSTKEYIEALAQSAERTSGHVDGDAEIE